MDSDRWIGVVQIGRRLEESDDIRLTMNVWARVSLIVVVYSFVCHVVDGGETAVHYETQSMRVIRQVERATDWFENEGVKTIKFIWLFGLDGLELTPKHDAILNVGQQQ